MAKTYEAIATATATGSQNTITFASVPSTYTDIILISTCVPTLSVGFLVNLNSDTNGINYSRTVMSADGSTAGSFRNSGSANLNANRDLGAFRSNATHIAHFMNYSNSTTFKTILTRFNNPSGDVGSVALLWRNTQAITNISLTNDASSNFISGSTFTLYGIKAA